MEDLEPIELKDILFYKEKLIITNEIKFVVYVLNMIFMILTRKEILNQEIDSPLIKVDDNLNKALFDNILRQSQFPENENLSIEYYKLMRESKIKSSGEFDRTDNNINFINDSKNSVKDNNN